MAISLASISRTTPKPPRVIVYGDSGVGKTTFGVSAPAPIVLQTEDGLGALDVDQFPLSLHFSDVMQALYSLFQEPHDYQTLVVDSLDWLEPLIWRQVCEDNRLEHIEKLPYGKGYIEALSHWRQFLDGVTALRDQRAMNIVMVAHSAITQVEDPTVPAYDSHGLKLHKRAAALAEEFADVILFAQIQQSTVTEDAGFNQKRIRAVSTGERICHAVGAPAFLAKSRYPMPSPLPLDWAQVSKFFPTSKGA
jgi:AAA domain